jgi:exodeoxyribonuclease-5
MADSSILANEALSRLQFVPLQSQHMVMMAMCEFIVNHAERDVFILDGYAGTGKTSVVGAVVKAMRKNKINTVILAPTGRAAKVASEFSDAKARTIQKRLFRLNPEPGGEYFIAENHDRNTIFIVDEASMVTDYNGNSSILSLLIRHVYSSPGCALIFVGDTAQLPPIGQSDSPAMQTERLKQFGLTPYKFSLTEPVRQAAQSGILYNATRIRQALFNKIRTTPSIVTSKFTDIAAISSADLVDMLSSSWQSVGQEDTLLITRSNNRANKYNQAIRNSVMYAEEPIERGERIIISKNNYFWGDQNKNIDFIANGEIAIVDWVGHPEKMYGRYFVDLELHFPGKEGIIAAKLMLRSLAVDGPSISKQEMETFQTRILANLEGEFTERLHALDKDPYFNALQAKYAYCVTCHKAQGGQWKHVYIDMSGIDTEALDDSFYRWLYTAITRATEKIFLINPTLSIK